MSRPLVYLAGGIAGLRGTDATDWRRKAGQWLAFREIESLDPMRSKAQLSGSGRISTDFRHYAPLGTFFTAKGIMARDYGDVKRADALLVNLLGLTEPSKGTIMELAWAYSMQKPAVVVMEPTGNPHDNHPMLDCAMPFRVTTLDEGIDTVAVILGR